MNIKKAQEQVQVIAELLSEMAGQQSSITVYERYCDGEPAKGWEKLAKSYSKSLQVHRSELKRLETRYNKLKNEL